MNADKRAVDEEGLRRALRIFWSHAPSRTKRALRAQQLKDPRGVKRQYVPWAKGEEIRTPYFIKELKRRRAAGKVAKQSRKRNRG